MILALALMGCGSGSIKLGDSLGTDTEVGGTDTADTQTGSDSSGDTTDSAGDTAPESGDTSGTDTGSDTATTPSGPCSDGGWGYGSEDSIIVVAGADDTVADGTMDAPFGTISAAIAYTVTASNLSVLIGPGTFFENLYMPLSEYNGLTIAGCGVDETTIAGDPVTEAVYWEGIEGAMTGLTVQIGENGIGVDGAILTLTDVNVTDSLEFGITVFDGGSLNATNVTIDSPITFGLDVQSRSSAEFVDSWITGASKAAVHISGGSATLNSLTISDTGGNPGFGVYVGEGGVFAAENLAISGGMTAGIMGYDATSIAIINGTIADIVAPDSSLDPADQHSDGIVMMLGGSYDPAGYMLAVDGLTVTDVGRSAVIAQGVTVTQLQSVTATTGYSVDGTSVFLQGGAVMADAAPASYVDLEEESLDIAWSW